MSTAIRTPPWFWDWCAAPPVRAGDVWRLLPAGLRAVSEPFDWIAPCYTRLAMGGSHSVHLLMQVNFEAVGRALWLSRKLATSPAHCAVAQVN